MGIRKTVVLGFCAAAAASSAPAANVVARKGNVWPTRSIDVLVCDAAAVDRMGRSVCARQVPKKGQSSRTARLDRQQAQLVRQTVRRWNDAYGQNIRLREVARPTAASTIVFRSSSRDSRCSTQRVGFVPSQRLKYISIGRKCSPRVAPDGTNMGTVAHEILHAIGLHHEQQRSDRAAMARVKRVGAKGHQWQRTCNPSEDRCRSNEAQAMPVGAYDFGSIMHYSVPAKAAKLTSAGRTRLSQQGLRKSDVGQRDWLSKADERGIRALYPAKRALHSPKAA